jgi:phosphopantetheine adenylyltransferase
MTTLDSIKNRLIDRILTARNEKLLEAIEKIFVSTQKEELVSLSSEQIEMLMMSEQDIKNGNLISESELDKLDTEWLG